MRLSRRDSSFRARRGQSGQGVVEYILLLVIAIALVLGVGYQFNDAFKQWANGYFGDYLTCLLETGELPTIGGTGGVASACAGQFKTFSLADGRPYAGGGGGPDGGGPGGGGGSDGDNDGGGTDTNEDDSDGRKGGDRDDDTAGGGTSYSRGSGEFGAGQSGRFRANNATRSADAAARSKRGTYTGSTENSIPSGATSGGRTGGSQRRRQLEGAYFVSRDQRPETGSEKPLVKITTEGSRDERKQRMIITRKLAAEGAQVKDEPMTFGDYLRYFLIAALIIIILIVLGGQLTQISNEME